MGKYILKCKMCDKEFENYNKNAKFCSKQCYLLYRKENGKLKNVTCPVCNKTFRQSCSGQIFCCVACRVKSTEDKLECVCEYCGRAFIRKRSEIEKNKHHYCSNECRMGAMCWGQEDVEILKINFGKLRYSDMTNIFSKYRDKEEIKRKAISLGLTSSRKWTDEEIEILINNYSKKPINEVAEMLPKRTISAILGQARQHNLKSFFYLNHVYSTEEERYLRDNYLTKSNEELSGDLNRTVVAIAQHLLVLNLYRPTDVNNYNTISEYVRKKIYPWRKKFAKSKNFTCELTGSSDEVVVHHIRGFNLLLEETVCVLNFPIYDKLSMYTKEQLDTLVKTFLLIQETYHSYICIDEKIHKHFHGIYGYGSNTEEQWNDFINTHYK